MFANLPSRDLLKLNLKTFYLSVKQMGKIQTIFKLSQILKLLLACVGCGF